MRTNKQDYILAPSVVDEQRQRREIYEALVIACDLPELLAETIAVLADRDVLSAILARARTGRAHDVIYEFTQWENVEKTTGIPVTYWVELRIPLAGN